MQSTVGRKNRSTRKPAQQDLNIDVFQSLCDDIDLKLPELAEEARVLGFEQNQLSPISRLPPELFLEIFRYLIPRTSRGSFSSFDTFGQRYGPQMVLSSVCRVWRNMILADYTLWADINTSHLPFAPELLKRSGAASLSISLQGSHTHPTKLMNRMLKLISEHHSRIQYLALNVKSLKTQIPTVLWKPAPIMTGCSLSRAILDPHRALFDGCAPLLTSLQLCEIQFAWNMPLLRAIPLCQELRIISPTSKPLPQQLSSILQSMPQLRILELTLALPYPESTLTNTANNHFPRQLLLPCLTALHIKGTSLECTSFINQIQTSLEHLTKARIICTNAIESNSYPPLQAWFSMIDDSWRPNQGHNHQTALETSSRASFSVHSLGVLYDESDFVNYTCSIFIKLLHDNSEPDDDDGPTLLLEWTPGSEWQLAGAPIDIVSQVLKFIPLPLSTCKRFTSHYALTREEWELCIRLLPNIEVLKLCTFQLPDMDVPGRFPLFVEALKPSGRIPFPNLKRVEVEDHSIAEQDWNGLLGVSEERKTRGHGFKTVIVGSNLEPLYEPRVVGKFEGIVEEFLVRRFIGTDMDRGLVVV